MQHAMGRISFLGERGALRQLLRISIVSSLVASVVLLLPTTPAQAAFPGRNGRIAFSAFDGTDMEIYTITPDGPRQQQVTNNSLSDITPAWSASGRGIAYAVATSSGKMDIFIARPDGT